MRLTQALADEAEAIVDVVKKAAREGNMQAIALVLARIAPPLKAQSGTVEFELDPNATASEMSAQILVAVSKGQLGPEEAKVLLDLISAHVGLRDLETFLAEVRRVKDSHARHPIPGGVVYQ